MLKQVGEVGVNLFDFYAMTWLEWIYYSRGLINASIKKWEHTRQVSWMIYRANSNPKTVATNMQSWWPLPTDEKPKIKNKKTKRLTVKQQLDFINSMR